MEPKIERSVTFDKLGPYQQPILAAVCKGLPGSAPDYAPMPNGNIALVVTWPGFEGRDDAERERLVSDTIVAAVRISPSDYISSIHCWTPREAEEIKAGESALERG
jgi:hypothetical protein